MLKPRRAKPPNGRTFRKNGPQKSVSFRKCRPSGRRFYIPDRFGKIFDFSLFLPEILLSFILFVLPKFLYY